MMDKAQTKRGKDGDTDAADKLRKAAKIGKEAMVPEKMKGVAKDIKSNHPNDAVQKQQDSVKSLEKMLAALDERKEDDLERLQKKHKNAGEVKENVDKLAKDQDRLQKKVKEANKIGEAADRAKELKKLAEARSAQRGCAKKCPRVGAFTRGASRQGAGSGGPGDGQGGTKARRRPGSRGEPARGA